MNKDKIISELQFKAVRSSGAGGQNVNKVSSKVVLRFDLNNSQALSDNEKQLLLEKLASRLTNNQILILNCDEDRSQIRNKEIVINRFISIIEQVFIIPKIRRPTKISRAVIKRRIQNKQNHSLKKELRKKPNRFE